MTNVRTGPTPKPRVHRARTVCLWLALLAAWSLGFAYAMEYGFGMHPCELCMLERYAFMGLLVVGLGGFMLDLGRLALLLCLAILLGLTGLTFYHVGVELGWFQLSATCSGTGKAASVDDLRTILLNARPTCDRPAWLIPNVVSMAQVTAAWAALLTILTAGSVMGPAFRR
jgi:disulfide bond formation protein DsbB